MSQIGSFLDDTCHVLTSPGAFMARTALSLMNEFN